MLEVPGRGLVCKESVRFQIVHDRFHYLLGVRWWSSALSYCIQSLLEKGLPDCEHRRLSRQSILVVIELALLRIDWTLMRILSSKWSLAR